MTGWLKLSDDQRRSSIADIEYTEGIQTKAIEKDWWVSLTLRALFRSKYKNYLLFKGGTSLSKCWKLIDRFSEDIDIAFDPTLLGAAPNENPTKSFVKKLRRRGCNFTGNELKKELEEQFEKLGLVSGTVKISADNVDPSRPDKDPQTLRIEYPSLYKKSPYLEDVVKIEVSIRYMKEPSSIMTVQSLLNEFLPNDAYTEPPFEVSVTDPHRTFLEKAFLLHEEFSRPKKTGIRTQRMSRHLYDMERIMDTEYGIKALEDEKLYQATIQLRKDYSFLSNMDYSTLERNKITFLIPEELKEAYKNDYKAMQEEMIYKPSLNFELLMQRLDELHLRFRNSKNKSLTIKK